MTMKTEDDLIVFLTRALREIEPAIQQEKVFRLEDRLRQRFGGERLYVAKPIDRRADLKEMRVQAALERGLSAREVARELRLSVRTVYRIKHRLPR